MPLSNLVTLETGTEPNALTQYNQLNSATFQAVPMPGVTMGQAVDFLEQQTAKLPAGFSHDYLSDTRQYVREGNQLTVTFVFALVVIFLVLAAQFESLRDPLVILVSVPMSMCGALLPLFFGLATMNIYTQVGLVTLIGLISKHGILMVEFANSLQLSEHLDRRQAIERAARVRLRPILMTTAAMVVGLVPLLTAQRRGRGQPLLDRARRRRRDVDRHPVHAVCAARRLHRAGQGPPRRKSLRPGPGNGGSRPLSHAAARFGTALCWCTFAKLCTGLGSGAVNLQESRMDQSTVSMTAARPGSASAVDRADDNYGGKSLHEIEEDIARTRVRLGATIDALERELAPRRVAEVLRNSIEPRPGPLPAQARDYAIPLALIVAGLGWLVLLRRSRWSGEMPSEFGEMPAEAVELGETPPLGSAYLEPEEPVPVASIGQQHADLSHSRRVIGRPGRIRTCDSTVMSGVF